MHVNPYLIFNGQCKQAFELYAKVLGAKVLFSMTWGESPMADQMPPEAKDNVMHSTLGIGNSYLMGADGPPGSYEKPAGTSVSISVENAADGKRIFDGLAEGGSVKMPFEKTFWAEGFGMCVDKFGVPWMVNCEGEKKM